MLKIIINDLLVNLKKTWVNVGLNIILFIFLTTYILTIIIVPQIPMDMPRTNDTIIKLLLEEHILRSIIPAIYGVAFITMFDITKKIPLRLSKAMFVCAAGEKEKMKYMYLQLAIKIILGFMFIFIASYSYIGRIFLNRGIILSLVEIILWFFIILDINLKIGIGEQGLKKKDKEGYIIYSKEEEMVNYYWICLLMLEAIVFYSLSILNVQLNFLGVIGWSVALIVNAYIAYRCINPILKKSLSYEDVYRQIPDTKEG